MKKVVSLTCLLTISLASCATPSAEVSDVKAADLSAEITLNFDNLEYYFTHPNGTQQDILLRDGRKARQGMMSLPRPNYPVQMIRYGKDGTCDVTLDLRATGEVENVRAECSRSGFQASAIKALSEIKFIPVTVEGAPIDIKDVTYPLEYTIG